MEKRSKWSRLLAVVLAVSMVFSSQSVSVLADVIGTYSVPKDDKPNGQDGQEEGEGDGGSEPQTQSDEKEIPSETELINLPGIITGENVNVRETPDGEAENVLALLEKGTQVTVLERITMDDESQWYRIEYDGTKAYVSADFVEISTKSPKKTELAAKKTDGGQEAKNSTEARKAILERAEDYYGDNAAHPKTVAAVTVKRTDSHGSGIKAGELLSFSLEYILEAAEVYNYSGREQSMYDTYDDTRIDLYLPEGLAIKDPEKVAGVSIKKGEAGHWILTLNDKAIAAQSSYAGTISLNVLVEGNGTLPVGKEFAMSDGSLARAEITTHFDVLDKTGGKTEVIKEYGKTYQGTVSASPVTSYSGDQWGIEKTLVGNPAVDKEKNTVTFTFRLKVGLKDSNGKVITDKNNYAVPGRTGFSQFNLTESLTVEGNEGLEPKEIIVTPKFGEKKPQIFKNNKAVEIPVDTVAGKNTSGTAVDGSAPYYSEYEVKAVYGRGPFLTSWKEGASAEAIQWKVQNTASISYLLNGESGDLHKEEAHAEAVYGEKTEPAKLTIKKQIQFYDGQITKAYKQDDSWNWGEIQGPAEFEIERTDSASSGEGTGIYKLSEDGTYQELPKNSELEIDSTGDGSVTVYLDPGQVKITETEEPAHTAFVQTKGFEQDQSITTTLQAGANEVIFTNKADTGKIEITKKGKKDGQESPLPGVTFGLYGNEEDAKNQQNRLASAATDKNGKAVFENLTQGTYHIREEEAPGGYIVSQKIYSATIKDNSLTQQIDFDTNHHNSAHVQLEKYVKDWTSGENTLVNASNYQEFADAFTLQEKVGEEWQDVQGFINGSLDKTGHWSPAEALPIYRLENGSQEPIQYRFKETLPEGWHGDGEKNRIVYSSEFTLENCASGEITTHTEKMVNYQNGSITLTKKIVGWDTSTGEQTERLANEDDHIEFQLYRKTEANAVEEQQKSVGSDGKIVFSDLPVMDEGGEAPYEYYLVEMSENTLELEGQTDIAVIEIDGKPAIGPIRLSGQENFEKEITAYNVEQSLLLKVVKVDSVTNNKVKGGKFKVEIEYGDGKETIIEDWEGGTYQKVDFKKSGTLIQSITITETEAPAGYQKLDQPVIKTREEALGEIEKIGRGQEAIEIEIKNTPYRQVKIEKTVNQKAVTTPVRFELYQKSDSGFEAVEDSNGQTRILTSGIPTRLPGGTYYLHEIVPEGNPNSILDPDKFHEKYSGENVTYDGTTQKTYFGPFKVPKADSPGGTVEDSVIEWGSIDNISSVGGIKVAKKNHKDQPLSGAKLRIYTKAGDQKTIVKEVVTGQDGCAVFEDIPVYGENGEKITYYIEEIQAPAGYYVSDKILEATLKEGKITGTDGEDESLEIINAPLRDLTVNKVVRNLWEYAFTGKEQPVKGAVIGLYKLDEDGETYKLAEKKTTDATGQVSWKDLEDGEYVAVEISSPDVGGKKTRPAGGKKYLSDNTESFPKAVLDKYNYVALAPQEDTEETLINEIGWTQIQVEKKDSEENKLLDGAIFKLYKQELPEAETSGELTFDSSQCELVGTYSSGTFIDAETGERQEGKFATDILETGKNIVYWLEEIEAPPGYKIDEAQRVILFKAKESSYTHSSNGDQSTKVEDYTGEGITKLVITNNPLEGPGPERFAYVSLSKWAEKQEGGYKPLGGAKYELYVANEDGELIERIDELTTGLESIIDEDTPILSSTATSIRLDYEDFKKYAKLPGNAAWWENRQEKSGDFYVHMALVETSAPFGYQVDPEKHYLILCFEDGEEKSTITYNETYYVKAADTEAPLASSLNGRYPEVGNKANYRLTDTELDNYSVTVRKYGYTPTEGTLNLTSDQLDGKRSSGELSAVLLKATMYLQRKDESAGSWKFYNYKTNNWANSQDQATFQTAGGAFSFPNGLIEGSYRIVETWAADESYELLYNDANHARYFAVSDRGVTVNMYNPSKLALTLEKTDWKGKPVKGNVTFTLNNKEKTAEQGKASFSNLGSGIYHLKETAEGYSNVYLQKYFEENYPLAKALVNETGLYLGYEKTATSEKEQDVTITAIKDPAFYGLGGTVTVKNPSLASLTLKKAERDTNEAVTESPTTFTVYWKPFDKTSGEISVPEKDSTYTELGEYKTQNGSVEIPNLNPGIYYIEETKAPEGYENDSEPYYVILTGGMGITVSKTELKPSIDPEELTFLDTPKEKLTVKKEIDWGALEEAADYSFTFVLYDEDGKEAGKETVNETNRSVEFDGLLRGEDYYLEEKPAEGYALSSVTQGDDPVLAETEGTHKGRYKITIPEGKQPQDISVTVTNTCQKARFTFKKADGSDGTLLKGAKFTVKKVDGTEETEVKADIKDNQNGSYTVTLPVKGKTTYRVYETKAPDGYLLKEGQYIQVELEPGDVKELAADWKFVSGTSDEEMLDKGVMPNYKGAFIQLTKYNNLKGLEASEPLAGAGFTLYQRKDEEAEWSVAADYQDVSTDGKGEIRFTVEGGYQYALSETKVPKGYKGLEGIWKDGGQEKLPEITIDGKTACILGSQWTPGETYHCEAYNIPSNIALTIYKTDLNNTITPKANVSVYEVPEGTKEILTKEEIAGLTSQKNPFVTVETSQTAMEAYTTYAGKEEYPELGRLEAGKTYLVVENSVTAANSGEAYQLDMEKPGVVWYQVFKATGEKKEESVLLYNAHSQVKASIQKTVDQESPLPSLYEGEQELTYTVTPSVENGRGLVKLTVTDSGIEGIPRDQFTITEMTIGQAKDENNGQMRAEVTFFDFNGQIVGEPVQVQVGAGSQSVVLPQAEDGGNLASFTVSYQNQALEEEGYAVGKGFEAGPITYKVKLYKQEGDQETEAIKKASNTVRLDWTYREYPSPISYTEKRGYAESKAEVTFKELEVPTVAVEKTAEADHVELGKETGYKLTLTNTSENSAAMDQPVLVDVLPEGATVDTSSDYAVISEGDASGLKISQRSLRSFGESTVVLLYFDQPLEAGASVSVDMKVKINKAVALHGNQVKNAVFASSAKAGTKTKDNPQGASFKGENGWAEALEKISVNILGAERAEALAKVLGREPLYGFISAHTDQSWLDNSNISLLKSNYGSDDTTGYSTDRLARTSSGGKVYYRLAVMNTAQDTCRTNLAVGDILPREGDGRGSKWPLSFEEITSVKIGGKDENHAVYYTTNEISSEELKAAAKEAQQAVPGGFSKELPADKSQIKAFIVVLKDAGMNPGENLEIEYTTAVEEYDQTELGKIGYENAVNNFVCQYSSYPKDSDKESAVPASYVMTSNAVSATLIPGKVKVGGHVWIDADGNGVWDDGGIDEYSKYEIVKKLLENIRISLFTYDTKTAGTEGLTPVNTAVYDQAGDTSWKENAEFTFANLDPAKPLDEQALYVNNQLNPADLKGDKPATYLMQATLPQDLASLFELTRWGGSYISQDPTQIPEAERTDSNFNGNAGNSHSERFYLWQNSTEEKYDNTKDIGFTLKRDLTIHKSAADNAGTPVEGAQFAVYGPFGKDAEITADMLTDANKIDTWETDQEGNLTVTGLWWFMKYVIVEEGNAPGYQLEGAAANGDANVSVTKLADKKAAWVLDVPNISCTTDKQTVTVTNVRKTTVSFKVSKKFTGRAATDADQFKFELLDAPNGNVLQEITVAGNQEGAFKPVTLNSVGTFYYYIREKVPENNPDKGITYDSAVYRAEVTTEWTKEEGLKAGEPAYRVYKDEALEEEKKEAAEFTNTYEAAGELILEAVKTVNGRTPKEEETFTFTLTSTDDTPEVTQRKANDNTGKIIFDKLSYTISDAGKTYTYEVKEEASGKTGYKEDETVYSVKVEIQDKGDGTLKITPEITRDGTPVKAMTFDNTYKSSGKAVLSGRKTVEGGPVRDHRFGIYKDEGLTTLAEEGKRVEKNQAAVNRNGSFDFNIFFDQDDILQKSGIGTVTLYIAEQGAAPDDAVNNDTTVYKVTYQLKDGWDGTIRVLSEKLEKKAASQLEWTPLESQEGVSFTNTYKAAGSVDITAKKVLTGKKLESGAFTFTLTDEEGNILQTKRNAAANEENSCQASISFDRISYNMEDMKNGDGSYASQKEFVYYLKETAGEDSHYTYSDETYKVTVTVTDTGTGTLDTAQKIEEEPKAEEGEWKLVGEAVFHNKYTTSGELTLKASKELKGQELKEGQFTFILKDVTTEEKILDEKTNDGSGAITFTPISYDQDDVDKTFNYEISEKSEGKREYAYDDTVYKVQVIPRDNGSEIEPKVVYWKAEEEIEENETVFRNSYKAEGSVGISGQKAVENRKAQVEEGEFTFLLTESIGADEKEIAKIKTQEGGSFAYEFKYVIDENTTSEELKALLTTHTYLLKENPGTDQEMDYSTEEYKIQIAVSDNGDGTLKIGEPKITKNGEEVSGITFTNVYHAKGEAELTVNKRLTGNREKGIGEGEFSFRATEIAVNGTPTAEGKSYDFYTKEANDADKYETTASVRIPYDQDALGTDGAASERKYEIRETGEDKEGVAIAETVYYAVVTVSDKGNHQLETQVRYCSDPDCTRELSKEEVTFVNTYQASGSVTLKAAKKLTGRALSAGEFQFEVYEKTKDGKLIQVLDQEGNPLKAFNDADGNIQFKEILYNQDDQGEHRYVITEKKGGDSSIDYDDSKLYVTVEVTDGGRGTLDVEVTKESQDLLFTNAYRAEGEAAFTADKVLKGGRGTEIADGEFTFKAVKAAGDEGGEASLEGRYDAESGKILFDTMSFDETDIGHEYVYRLTEDEGTDDSILYSKGSYYAKVSISDKGKGKLDAKVSYFKDASLTQEAETAVFANQYLAKGEAVLEARKNLDGRDQKAGEFIFEVCEVTEKGRTPVLDQEGNPLRAFNNGDGTIVFEPIPYSQDDQGEHQYEILEVPGNAESITYDTEPVKVTVSVKDERGDGRLTVNTAYESGQEAHTAFENSYQAKGSVVFMGIKRLLGNRGEEVKEGEFTFTVTDKETGEEAASGMTKDGGVIEFTAIQYQEDQVGTHTYVISENMGKDESVSYTAPSVEVSVEVTDNTDGTLEAVASYPETGIVFENQYFAEGELVLTGTKELLGNRGADMKAGEFAFEMRELDAFGQPMEEAAAFGQNEADGTIAFEPIRYQVGSQEKDLGTHRYVISEIKGEDPAVEYSGKKRYVTVQVTDAGRGLLNAEIVAEESDEVLFENRYRAKGELVLDNFSKELTGSLLAAGQFEFELRDEDGSLLQTVTNGADGRLAFEALSYDETDIGRTYTYTVSEKDGGVTGVTYDKTVYTVIVKVEDGKDSDGTLSLDVTIQDGEDVVEGEEDALAEIVFANTFAGSVTLTKQGSDGRSLAGAEFKLYAKDGETFKEYTDGVYTTDEEGKIQVAGLPANDYYFMETKAPKGYVAETDENGKPKSYEFTIGVQDGAAGVAENAAVNASVTVTNDGAKTGSIEVTKRVGQIGDNFDIVGFPAVDETYYVGLFLDAAGAIPYGTDNVKAIHMDGVSVSEPVSFDGLPSGAYYVLETDAQGKAIAMNQSQQDEDGSVYYCTVEGGLTNQLQIDLTVSEEPATLTLTNVYSVLPSDYYWDAVLNITKTVLKDGEKTTVEDTFYAGIFQLTEEGGYELLTEVALKQNDTVKVTGLAGPVGGSMTYYVFETDGKGNRVSEDADFAYGVSGEGSVTVTEQQTTANVAIVNETADAPKYPYKDASIDITKKVLKNGRETTVDDTFYAGVYELNEDGEYDLLTQVELKQNGTVTVEGLSGPMDGEITYYVFETDGKGSRVSEDPAFAYGVSGEGSVTIKEGSHQGSITIINETDSEDPGKPNKPEEPGKPKTPTAAATAKTGDNTDISMELLLMALAIAAMGIAVYRRKRRDGR